MRFIVFIFVSCQAERSRSLLCLFYFTQSKRIYGFFTLCVILFLFFFLVRLSVVEAFCVYFISRRLKGFMDSIIYLILLFTSCQAERSRSLLCLFIYFTQSKRIYGFFTWCVILFLLLFLVWLSGVEAFSCL